MKDLYALQTKHYSNSVLGGMSPTLCSDRPRYINKVKNVDFSSLKIKRCGIVPFSFNNNDIIFYLGVDTKSNEITDFGGTINTIINETPIQCAIREFKEESLDVFDNKYLHFINDAMCIYDIYRIVIFINVPFDDYNKMFSEKVKEIQEPLEVKNIISFTSYEFKLLSKGKLTYKLYNILINFFKSFSVISNWLPFLYNNPNHIVSVTQNSTNSLNTII